MALLTVDDGVPTQTFEVQKKLEHLLLPLLGADPEDLGFAEGVLCLLRKHKAYLHTGLRRISSSYTCLDASRPWIVYWIAHSLDLLRALREEECARIVDFLRACAHPHGGYGGGPMQLAHLAPTYAAVLALAVCGTPEAYSSINRKKIYVFLKRMRTPEGTFRVHEDGEVDVRGAYTAIVVAKLLNLEMEELFEGTAEWIASCQTYEGGMGGVPGNEAHGGYTYCAVAALEILGKGHLVDQKRLLEWCVQRQMRLEGGFQGRTNKLVDGCYSFWVGALFPILDGLLHGVAPDSGQGTDEDAGGWLFNQQALQNYVLRCCQVKEGGLRDKPGKTRDFYHTCYCLSGLSIAQHSGGPGSLARTTIVGDPSSLLSRVHPWYNIQEEKIVRMREFFIAVGFV